MKAGGAPRPGAGTDACDIGAYEVQAIPPTPPPAPPTPGTGPISAAPGFTG